MQFGAQAFDHARCVLLAGVGQQDGKLIAAQTARDVLGAQVVADRLTDDARLALDLQLSGEPLENEQWTITLDGTDFSYLVAAGDDLEAVAAELAIAINASGDFTAADLGDGLLRIDTVVAGALFTFAFEIGLAPDQATADGARPLLGPD